MHKFEELGHASFAGNRYADAEKYLSKAIHLRTRLPTAPEATTIALKAKLAVVFCFQERWDDAESILTPLSDKKRDINTLATHCLHVLSVAFLGINDLARAERNCKRTLTWKKKIIGKHHPSYLETVALQARICDEKGDTVDAEAWRHWLPRNILLSHSTALEYLEKLFPEPRSFEFEPVEQLYPEVEDGEALKFFEELRRTQSSLDSYKAYIAERLSFVPAGYVSIVSDHIRRTKTAVAALTSDYASIQRAVSAGKAEPKQLSDLLTEFSRGDSTPWKVAPVTNKYREKMDFIATVTAKGAKYIGFNGLSLKAELARNDCCENLYLFYFNDEAILNAESWSSHLSLLELLQDDPGEKVVLLVDCDAKAVNENCPRIIHRRNGRIITHDLLEEREFLAANCIIRYDEAHIDRSKTTRPLQRRPVRIPCPGLECESGVCYSWLCSKCHQSVEYGYIDDRLYCGCGSCRYDLWEFKCNNPKHGSVWKMHDLQKLRQLLNACRF